MSYRTSHRPGEFCSETGNYNEVTPLFAYDYQDMPGLYRDIWCRVGEVMPETSSRYKGQKHKWKLVNKDQRQSTNTAETLNRWKESSEHLTKLLTKKVEEKNMSEKKKLILMLMLLGTTIFVLLFGTKVFAQQWWSHHAQIYVTSTVVEAAFSNNTNVPIYCEGTVFGETYNGALLKNSSHGIVPPFGGVGGIFVYTNTNDPFVNGWANLRCTTNF